MFLEVLFWTILFDQNSASQEHDEHCFYLAGQRLQWLDSILFCCWASPLLNRCTSRCGSRERRRGQKRDVQRILGKQKLSGNWGLLPGSIRSPVRIMMQHAKECSDTMSGIIPLILTVSFALSIFFITRCTAVMRIGIRGMQKNRQDTYYVK